MNNWITLIVCGVITVMALLLFLLYRHVWRTDSQVRHNTINLSISLFSVLYAILISELLFSALFVQSSGANITLSSKRWFEKYWNPINSYGYRDYEHIWKDNVLFVLGDSFIAGHGIKNIDDRFANILASKVEKNWTVAVLAKNGWNLENLYNALISHPKIPDRIIVSYFLNDIVSAARRHGFRRTNLKKQEPGIFSPLVDNSYLFNWLYWRFALPRSGDSFLEFIGHAYNDEEIWSSHTDEIQKLVNYARDIDAKLTFLVWPRMSDVDRSTVFTSKVVEFLEHNEIHVINLSDQFLGRELEALRVNPWDGHPSVEVNAEVAEIVYKTLGSWD